MDTEAEVYNDNWALHKPANKNSSKKGYMVTHVPSGMSLEKVKDLTEGRRIIHRLLNEVSLKSPKLGAEEMKELHKAGSIVSETKQKMPPGTNMGKVYRFLDSPENSDSSMPTVKASQPETIKVAEIAHDKALMSKHLKAGTLVTVNGEHAAIYKNWSSRYPNAIQVQYSYTRNGDRTVVHPSDVEIPVATLDQKASFIHDRKKGAIIPNSVR